jgi:hypothetical protein
MVSAYLFNLLTGKFLCQWYAMLRLAPS